MSCTVPRLPFRGVSACSLGWGGFAAVCLLASSGCRGAAEERGEDDAFLRTNPSELQSVEYNADAPLFPVKAGNWWDYQVQTTTRTADGKASAAAPYRERSMVAAPAVINGRDGIRFDFTRAGQKARTETYASSSRGIFVLGAKAKQTVTMSSPLPLLQFPAREGEYFTWDGLLDFEQTSAPGRSYSRITAKEPVKTPLGTFNAWRVDTEVETNIGGRGVQQFETRWFAPGYGIVRQESRAGNQLTVRVLVDCFKGSKK